MITKDFKERIIAALKHDRNNFGSDAKHSVALDVSPAQYSRINKGELDHVISDEKWITLARRVGVELNPKKPWVTAKTPTFDFIYSQLSFCQQNGLAGLLCDNADIGKTHAGKEYAKANKHCVYIDCSQVKTKQKLVRQIAKEFGVNHTGRYADVYEDLVYFLNVIGDAMIILDEAGDLAYDAFLELKALWNATEGTCGWYMMGADGLRAKITSGKDRRKVGFTEIFSRYGNKYQKIAPEGREELERWNKLQVGLISQVNAANINPQTLYAKTDGSLRRVRTELQKMN